MDHKRILLVDDEPQLTKLLKMNLDDSGVYDVATANDGPQALAQVAACRPDLIVLDVLMPGMDGGEVAARLRAAPATCNIPIIFLTAVVSRNEVRSNGGQLSGAPCLAKPVNMEELLQYIATALNAAHEGGET